MIDPLADEEAKQLALWEASEPHIDAMSAEELREQIRQSLLAHIERLGLTPRTAAEEGSIRSKELIRNYHGAQRVASHAEARAFVDQYGPTLLRYFAAGREVDPDAVSPVLCPVVSNTKESSLFRLATLLWSIPVSSGYGRRMRYLVLDGANGKLIGLFALTDPVFNLRARDSWIGWSVEGRRKRLVNVMDAFVLGAVPPYAQLLGGKVVASMMTAQEVCVAFADRYGHTEGIISKEQKHAQLALITVTSAPGRSSLYNRLYLPDVMRFFRLGFTEGWGHFQVPDTVFMQMRRILALRGHKYALNHQGIADGTYRYARGHVFGQGPNWRLRLVREALKEVGLNQDLLRHGIGREVFAAPLAPDWQDFLRGEKENCTLSRPSAEEIGRLAVARWLTPRAARMPSYQTWTRDDTWRALTGSSLAVVP